MPHSKKTEIVILLILIISFYPLWAGENVSLLLVNQADRNDIPFLSEFPIPVNDEFKDNLESAIIFFDNENTYVETRDTADYIRKAGILKCDFIVINTFSFHGEDIIINSEIISEEDGMILFSLSSSGTLELGIDRKLAFIVERIRRTIDKEIKKKENSTEDLFAQIFGGQQENPDHEITVPLLINEYYECEITIIPSTSSDVRISSKEIQQILKPKLITSINDLLSDTIGDSDFINLHSFPDLGLSGLYNSRELTLSLTIPLELLRIQPVSFAGRRETPPSTYTEQANFSAYLNVYFDQKWKSLSSPSIWTNEFPGSFSFYSSFNIRKWVLNVNYQLHYPYTAELPEFSIIHDFRKEPLRLTIGHFPIDSTGFQHFGFYQGISIDRMTSINGPGIKEHNQFSEFQIDTPSFVSVYVNNNLIKGMHLDAGRYNLQDFPLAAGVNSVQLSIEDSFGNRELFDFIIPYDSKSLQKREFDYSLSIGVPPFTLDNPIFTGFFRYGFTDFFTAGIDFQTDFQTEMAGLNIIFPTKIGTFDLAMAQTFSSSTGFGIAANFSYRFFPARNSRIPMFGFSTLYISRNYKPVGIETTLIPNFIELNTFISYNLLDFMLINPGAIMKFGRDLNGNSGEVFLKFKKRFGKNLSVNLDIKALFPSDSPAEFSAAIMVHINDHERNQTASIKSDTQTPGIDMNWNRSFESDNQVSVSAGLSGLPFYNNTGSSLFARASVSANRFNGNLYTALFTDSQNNFSSLIQAQLASALVYAGGHLALSRPVTDSFAIIVPMYNLENRKIGVNPTQYGYTSTSDFLGPPVINNLASYNSRRINIDIIDPEIEIDTETGNSAFTVFPEYKSGTVLYTGTQKNVYVTGRLLTDSGEVLSLKAGEISNEETETNMFFTDQEGIFFIYGIQPGSYKLRLYGTEIPVDIFVPEDTKKQFNLGEIIYDF